MKKGADCFERKISQQISIYPVLYRHRVFGRIGSLFALADPLQPPVFCAAEPTFLCTHTDFSLYRNHSLCHFTICRQKTMYQYGKE